MKTLWNKNKCVIFFSSDSTMSEIHSNSVLPTDYRIHSSALSKAMHFLSKQKKHHLPCTLSKMSLHEFSKNLNKVFVFSFFKVNLHIVRWAFMCDSIRWKLIFLHNIFRIPVIQLHIGGITKNKIENDCSFIFFWRNFVKLKN